MNDPIETRIRALPLRKAPAAWRSSILASVTLPVPEPPRRRWPWIVLAAAWVFIAGAEWLSHPSDIHGTLAGRAPLPPMLWLSESQLLRKELPREPLEERDPVPPPPTQGSLSTRRTTRIA